MAEVSLEMLQSLTQRVQDEQGSIREDIAKIRREMGRMSGRIFSDRAPDRSFIDLNFVFLFSYNGRRRPA
jgi:hypothetical protein